MERILCAAIWYINGNFYVHQPVNISNGYVVTGMRHHNVIAIHKILSGKGTNDENTIQGFLTTANRFVDRQEAAVIAYNAGQMISKKKKKSLFSEDIY